MAVTDPVDARLLAMLSDMGKVAVHELAARVGMDPREVAYRLVALSGSGLPLLVGVECDQKALRAATAGAWQAQTGIPSGQLPAQGPASGPMPQGPASGPMPQGPVQGTPSGAYPAQGPAQGTPSGAYPTQGPVPTHGGTSGPHAVPGTPSAAYPAPSGPPQGRPSGPHAVPGTPSAAYPAPPGPPQGGTVYPSQPPLSQQQPPTQHANQPPAAADAAPPEPTMSTWGPPQTASWARGDQAQPATSVPPSTTRGRIGDVLSTTGLEGEQLDIQLLEVQDPADYLFGAAGYRLEPGERAIVVHTEIKNVGQVPFVSLPDNYLELLTDQSQAIGKAPVSLTSRPPHRIGVKPGETLGGHTVYVLPEATRVLSVRWNRRPESDEYSLTWSIDD